MSSWDGKERRSMVAIDYIKETIDGHVKSDEIMFKELSSKLHELDIKLASLISLNTESLKNGILTLAEVNKVVTDHNKFIYDPKDGASLANLYQ